MRVRSPCPFYGSAYTRRGNARVGCGFHPKGLRGVRRSRACRTDRAKLNEATEKSANLVPESRWTYSIVVHLLRGSNIATSAGGKRYALELMRPARRFGPTGRITRN